MKTIYKEDLLPVHYIEINEPIYTGRGNHSINQLEDIAEGYKEFVHQLRIREQLLLDKLGVSIINKPTFQYNEVVQWKGVNYYFKEEKDGKILIANAKNIESLYYDDLWVEACEVYKL